MIFAAEDQIPTIVTAGGAVVLISTLGTVVGLFVRGTLKTNDRADGLHDAAVKLLQNQIKDLRADIDEAEERGETRWQKERQERLDERARYEDLLTTSERRHQQELERIRQEHREEIERLRKKGNGSIPPQGK